MGKDLPSGTRITREPPKCIFLDWTPESCSPSDADSALSAAALSPAEASVVQVVWQARCWFLLSIATVSSLRLTAVRDYGPSETEAAQAPAFPTTPRGRLPLHKVTRFCVCPLPLRGRRWWEINLLSGGGHHLGGRGGRSEHPCSTCRPLVPLILSLSSATTSCHWLVLSLPVTLSPLLSLKITSPRAHPSSCPP